MNELYIKSKDTYKKLAEYFERSMNMSMRKLELQEKKMVGPDLIRLVMKIDHIQGLPSELSGRHIKLVFSQNFKKTFTISSYRADKQEIDIDMAFHLKGKSSQWAQNAVKGDCLGMLGPKLVNKSYLEKDYKKVWIYSDLSGYGTVRNYLFHINTESQVNLLLSCSKSNEIESDLKSLHKCEILYLEGGDKQNDHVTIKTSLNKFCEESERSYVIAIGERAEVSKIKEILDENPNKNNIDFHIKPYWKASN